MLTFAETKRHRERRRRSSQCGVTLTELMVGLTVGTLVLSGTTAVYLMTTKAAAENIRHARLNQELRAVIEIMQQDIRRAGYWALPKGADPAENPFQNQIGDIEHDLRTGAAIDEPAGSCLTYAYDLNANARVGFCDGCASIGPPFDNDAYDRSNMEMFGFRLRGASIQMRTRRTSGSELTFDCRSGWWEAITSGEILVTRLSFSIRTRPINLNPAKARTDICATADLCQQIRTVEILLAGQLTEDPGLHQTLSASIAVRNDRYRVH
jgi:type II secretory pathway component PulJ